MKEKILITSLSRVNQNTPWRVGVYINGNYTYFNVGNKGSVAMSPRFTSFLIRAQKEVKRYPVDISFHSFSENRDIEITRIKNQIVYVDCGYNVMRILPNARFYYQDSIMGNPLMVKESNGIEDSNAFSILENIKDTIDQRALDYVAIAKVESVTDGDTIDVSFVRLSDHLKKYFNDGQTVTIRFNGVDTPEKRQEGAEEYKDPKNTKFGKDFGLTMDDMYEVGHEAHAFTTKTLGWTESNKPLVVLNFDREKDGSPPMEDTGNYGRYVADVYATKEKSADILMNKLKEGSSLLHLCKTLLKTHSKKFPNVPLGLFPFDYSYGTSVLSPFDWASELDLNVFDPGKQYSPGDDSDDSSTPDTGIDNNIEPYDDNFEDDALTFTVDSEPASNTLDFFDPYDDRLDEFTKGIQTTEDLKHHPKVRIGDVILTIPPTSIEVNKTSKISKVKTLRTKSSVLVNSGQTLTTLTLDLYFHDLESINGKKYPWKKDYKDGEKKKYFYVDGLRPLLAQFSKTPFVPIDNFFINDVIGVRDVALMDLEVTTVPNFPESLMAKITLVEFNCQAYLLDRATMGDAINYPMMRWFYNTALEDRGNKYRFFEGIDGPIKSDINFTLAEEEYLARRKNAIDKIKSMDSPEKVKMEMKQTEDYKTKKSDVSKVKEILEQYDRYSKASLKEYSVIDDVYKLHKDNIADNIKEKYKVKTETAENAVEAGAELFATIYDGKFKKKNISEETNIFLPYEGAAFYRVRFDIGPIEGVNEAFRAKPPVDFSKDPYKGKEKKGLFVIEDMEDKDNHNKLQKSYKKYYDEDNKVFIIPVTADAIKILKDISGSLEDLKDTVDKYEDDFNATVAEIDASENGVPLKKFEIEGSVVPISLNVRYSNEFSVAHVKGGEAATLQYMGGGDTYVDLVLEVDEAAARDFNRLIAISDNYAKMYNQGITNGYIGIENDLTKILGIKTIMFESLTLNSIAGFPGRYQIFLQAIGFNKTQRQAEELRALPGNYKHIDLEQLQVNKGAYANDRMIEARLHNSEVYPDLELPTYDQLNKVLPELDAGKIENYVNQTAGTFVDPDFYVSTVNTFRKWIDGHYAEEHRLNMYDGTGVAAYTSSGDMEKMFDTTEEDWGKLQELEKDPDVKPIGWMFEWNNKSSEKSSQGSSKASAKQEDGEAANEEEATFKNPDVKSFLTESVDGQPTYYSFPTKEEWEKLFKDDYKYDKYSSKPNPTETEVYEELDKLVDAYFDKYYAYPKFIKTLRGDLKSADKSKKNLSYAAPNQMYLASLGVLETTGGMMDLRAINKLIRAKKLDQTSGVPTKGIDQLDFNKAKKKVSKERFMTLLKSFFDATNKWQHYNGKNPFVKKTGHVGISQIDISGKDMSVDEVKRLMYNWKYNMKVAIKKLADGYKKATKMKEDFTNMEVCARPWDAMFAYYYDSSAKLVRSEDIKNNDFAYKVVQGFDKYAMKPFDTYSGINIDVYRKFAGLSKEEKRSIGEGKTEDYLTALIDLEYYTKPVLKKEGLTVESDRSNIKKAMKKYLESKKYSKDQIYSIYQTHLKKLHGLATSSDKEFSLKIFSFTVIGNGDGKKDGNGYFYPKEIYEKGEKLYQAIEKANKTVEASQEATDTRLYNDVDPRVLYQEMFYDLRNHDQRGRLLRAFPAFQMMIVHEGAYFGKYKFWDNAYGFNAIESIDVYRSRKIAADTAVIRMSNVYSNLTTRRTDVDYIDRQLKWWDNYVWNEIPQELVDKKANEIHKNIYLETGARIHLRLGYGSAASNLPVVFNGTITEMDTSDVVEIVCQGDGVELGSAISGDPDDQNDNLFKVVEPRDLMCKLMSSKGSWFKDVLNGATDGQLFQTNPLGIMHFGQAWNTEDGSATGSKPLGNVVWWNDEYGEVAQNIYSSNGSPTFSQWLAPNGERNTIFEDFSWEKLRSSISKPFQPGDERDVLLKLYNLTTWDVVQTLAYTSPDYIAAVHPFELRSTLFFGKPYWRAAFQYNSRYQFDAANKSWSRHLNSEARRPYMQNKFYTSSHDIISNDIKVSEDNLYTNVIVSYDKHQTPTLYADVDIRYDKQKTRVVEASIVATAADYYRSEVVASYYGASALRDNLKDMYRGNLLVMGDPTVKPHDMMYISDSVIDMQGNCLVKAVTHHFSAETGFVTSIEPDLLVVNDDPVILEMSKWFFSFCSTMVTTVATRFAANLAAKNFVNWVTKSDGLPGKVGKWYTTKGLRQQLKLVSDGSQYFEDAIKTLDQIIAKGSGDVSALYAQLQKDLEYADKWFAKSTGKTAVLRDFTRRAVLKSSLTFVKTLTGTGKVSKLGKSVVSIARGAASFTPVGFIINSAIWIGSEMIFEHYRRFKENLQTVICIPLSYKGQELTAGINGHAGMVYGEDPGRIKKLLDAQAFDNDGEDIEGTFGNTMTEIVNFLSGAGGMYANPQKQKELNDF